MGLEKSKVFERNDFPSAVTARGKEKGLSLLFKTTDNEQNFGQSDPKLNQSIGSAQIK